MAGQVVVAFLDGSNRETEATAATPLPVTVIAGGGAGTQYSEGDTPSPAVGNVMLYQGAADALLAPSDTDPLPVQQAALTATNDTVTPYAPLANVVVGHTADITNTTATTVIAAPGASLHIYLTHILIQNSHATVGTWVNVTEETSGTVLYTVYAGPLGGGASITLPVPIQVPTANKALQVTCVTTGSNVRASASGYKAA